METDMSVYGLVELTPEEASATSGGSFWGAMKGVFRGLGKFFVGAGMLMVAAFRSISL
ncbi:hypothetical protein [Bradyrhizobium sp. BWA-3-5]|uniref:hypothetical protein n=1 Tax=Bradyrhizobium sp. BWA-3-5 TaxID=3080013 RepID=UPI00293E3565|nr:hypothetical protein [Bradyrhizobium sp. BWA-3-5]WOH63661.1 hypothetical protein RX331_23430 [Bradyrhizobium sp. BWA-3-5]